MGFGNEASTGPGVAWCEMAGSGAAAGVVVGSPVGDADPSYLRIDDTMQTLRGCRHD